MAETKGFFHRIRGNAEWEAVRWVWAAGRSAVISMCYWGLQRLRHVHADWVGMGILFFLIMILGYLLGKGKPSISVDPDVKQAKPSSVSPSPQELEADAEQKRWRDWANDHNLSYYYNLGVDAERLFSPLQMEALKLSDALGKWYEAFEPEPKITLEEEATKDGVYDFVFERHGQWINKLNASYQLRWKAKLDKLVLEFAEQGVTDPVINQLSASNSKNAKVLLVIRERLVAMSHRVKGLSLTTENTA